MPYENYTISEYMSDREARSRSYRQRKLTLSYMALVFFTAGPVTLHFGFTVVAVAVLAIGAFLYQGSFHYMLLEGLMAEHYYLARLLTAQQASDLAALRSEVQNENHGKDHP